jgi:hypothetical protein
MLQRAATDAGYTFDHLGIGRAFEHTIEESYFAFWQYGSYENCPNIPAPTASADEMLQFLLDDVGFTDFTDWGIDYYEAYYFQAASQIGYPAPYDYHLRNLQYRGSDIPEYYVNHKLPEYDYLALLDVQLWLALQGDRIMFIYGGDDPWSSAEFRLGAARDSYELVVPHGNHGSGVWALDATTQAGAMQTLARWANAPLPAPAVQAKALRTLARKAIDLSDPPMPQRGPTRFRTMH